MGFSQPALDWKHLAEQPIDCPSTMNTRRSIAIDGCWWRRITISRIAAIARLYQRRYGPPREYGVTIRYAF